MHTLHVSKMISRNENLEKKREKPNLRLNTEKRKLAAAEAKVVSQLGIGTLSSWGLGAWGLGRRDLRG